MLLLTERLDSYIKDCFQKDIHFEIAGKKFSEGKLLVYALDEYYLRFVLKGEGIDNIILEIPFPFNIEKEGSNKIKLDYRLESLSERNYNLLFMLQSMNRKRKTKFYNSVVDIIIHDQEVIL